MSIFYNGSFCPVHEGHIDVALAALEHVRRLRSHPSGGSAEKIPSAQNVRVYMSPSHSMYVRRKGKSVYVPLRHRLDLLHKAIGDHDDEIIIDTNECFKPRHVSLKQIMAEFANAHPNQPLYWLQGADVANNPPPGWISMVVVNRGTSSRSKKKDPHLDKLAENENVIVVHRPHLDVSSSSIRAGSIHSIVCSDFVKRRGLWTDQVTFEHPPVPEHVEENNHELQYIPTHSRNHLFSGADQGIFVKKCEATSPEPELYSSLIGARLSGLIPELLGKTGTTLCLQHAGNTTDHEKGWDLSHWRSVVEQLAVFHAEFWDAPPTVGGLYLRDALDTDGAVRRLKGRLRKRKALLERIQQRLSQVQEDLRGGFMTVVHGDVWCGNVAFVDGRAVFLDLETLGRGHPLVDLAFAMIDSVDPAHRHESEMKALYHETLVRHTGIWFPVAQLFANWKAAKTFACAKALTGGLFIGGNLEHRLLHKLFD